jgi:radical SAM protein with 4Fe4S-binding SPASM domain
LILTRRCGLRCHHCILEAFPATAAELTRGDWLALMSDARDAGIRHALFTGGEPLLHPDLEQLLDAARRFGIRVTVSTSLAAVSPSSLRLLAHDAVGMIQTSIDGASASTHDARRGLPGAFDSTCHAIAGLSETRKPVVVSFTVTEDSRTEVESVISLAEGLQVYAFTVNDLLVQGRARETGQSPMGETAYEELRDLFRRRSTHSRTKLLWSGAAPPRGVPPDPEREFIISRCSACLTKCAIGPDGTVFPCVFLPRPVGDLNTTCFGDLWNTDRFAAIRDRNGLKGRCATCDFKLSCGGCRARAYAETGDVMGQDPRCKTDAGGKPAATVKEA